MRFRRLAVVLIFGPLVLSVGQLLLRGEISWHRAAGEMVVSSVREFVTRPDAAWRKASEALNDLVPAQELPGTFDLVGQVVRVSDGDTISILDAANRQHTIRLYGIDTPEYDQPHGSDASRALAQLIDAQQVGVQIYDTDRLGRTVGMVYFGGLNINVQMVSEGHAWWYRQYAIANRELKSAETTAKTAGLGLWSGGDAVPPWDWRRGKR